MVLEKKEEVVVIGLGYIGFPTAALIASKNIKVVGVDINPNTVESVNQGKVHIVEPELDSLVRDVVSSKYLRAVEQPVRGDIFIVAVPTPFDDKQQPDLSYVIAALKSIAPVLRGHELIILESTSPVGTTEKICEILSEIRPDLSYPNKRSSKPHINIAYCPERVLPGKIIFELVSNDRIIGGLTSRCSKRAVKFYKLFTKGELIITNSRTAEMCKLTENAFRDVNIAFANELSVICDKLDINVWELINLSNRHPRVNVLKPGPGVGGHCIAIDPWFIVSKTPEHARLIRKAREINESKPHFIVEKILDSVKKVKISNIAFFGLAYKPDIDDLRESPALTILETILKEDIEKILVVEPFLEKLPNKFESYKNVRLVSIDDAIEIAEIFVLLVGHSQFKLLKDEIPAGKITIDACGLLD